MSVLIAVIFPQTYRGDAQNVVQFIVDEQNAMVIQRELSNPDLRFLSVPQVSGETLSINISGCRGIRFVPQPDTKEHSDDAKGVDNAKVSEATS
jgi:hypothetical protein